MDIDQLNIEHLDATLRYFYDDKKYPKPQYPFPRASEIIGDKLFKDAFSTKRQIDNTIVYAITFEGVLFLQNGGYKEKAIRDNEATNHAAQVERVILANNKWMKIGTVSATVVAFLLLLFEVYKYFYSCP